MFAVDIDVEHSKEMRQYRHIFLLALSKFNQISELLKPVKSTDNHRFSDHFRGNRSYLIRSNLLNIRSKIWRLSLSYLDDQTTKKV